MRLRSTRRTFIRRISLILACLLIACPAANATQVGEELQIGVISVSTYSLNPLAPVEREMRSLTSLIYEGLVQIDDDYLPQPCLAEKWESSSGGGTWYFTLRENVTFHDGTPLTANDVVATVNEILRLAENEDAASQGAYANLKYFISSISANDNRTVVIKTQRTNYAFPYEMTFPILPASQVQAENPPGTGAYYVEAFIPTDYLYLSAYDGWWQAPPKVRQIVATLHATNRDLISSYEYNRVDAIVTRSVTAAQYRTSGASLNIACGTNQLETLLMNNGVRELKDIRVRQAIRCAINVDAIISSAYMSMADKTATPMPAGTWMYEESTESDCVYDPERAKQLLTEAGWEDSDEDGTRDTIIDGAQANMRLRFYVYEEQENSVRLRAANLISSMLAQVGIKAVVETMTYSAAKEALKAGNFDLMLAAYNMDVAPDPGFMLMSGNTGNYCRYRSDAMTQLCKELRACMTQAEYAAKLSEIQKQFVDDCPFMCLYYRTGALLTRKVFTTARSIREPCILRGVEVVGNE